MITENPNNNLDSTDSGHSKHSTDSIHLPLSKLYELFKPDKPCPERSERVSSFIFYLSILFFIIGFNFSDRMVGNWYQQFLPNIGGRSIQDVFFLDSLTGWSVTNATNQNPDTIFVLKTTNSGDNWAIQYRKTQTGGGFSGYFKVNFLNQNTGYTCDVLGVYKTTDGGLNWTSMNAPLNAYLDMSVLSTDTIWIVTPDNFAGGVFFTSNGGASWQNRLNIGSQNPNHIYMFNGRIGFIAEDGFYLRKTTDSGINWTLISGAAGFKDLFFIDSLTGWKCNFDMKKTTDGGLTWINQILPFGGNILGQGAVKFMNMNNDTIWATGESIIVGGSPSTRGILYRTIDGGSNWLFQLPDTSIHIVNYFHGQFINNKIGWAYQFVQGGIHTTNGGDTTFIVPVNLISTEVPKEFKLFQNFPNPFNPETNIKYQIISNVKRETSNVKLIVYDIQGKQIVELVNQKQNPGTYEASFNGSNYSTGVYFYSLIIDGKAVDTKRMILIK